MSEQDIAASPSATPADDIVIRPAVAADRPFLISLDERLVEEAVVPEITRDQLIAFQSTYTREALDADKPGMATLIAVDGTGRPLGYIQLEPHHDMLTGETSGYVSILAVRAEAQGRGVAKRLLDAADDWAVRAGFRFLMLDVFASNATARRFYERRGFVDESLRLRRKLPD
ncbi:GNAT family N-acetyltransferase [Dongia sedimenti]|uniref:GNAT family N-acetyltransferase n=1 Tax=Dongia sedimenti TaxID=3064282 RepID=A0ABU0YR08_9PROT|nr:GNAT family N-acetyltransferase [Rhodospirillaceae bacterium R-7]